MVSRGFAYPRSARRVWLTDMLKADHPGTKMLLDGAIEPEQVAEDVVKGHHRRTIHDPATSGGRQIFSEQGQ